MPFLSSNQRSQSSERQNDDEIQLGNYRLCIYWLAVIDLYVARGFAGPPNPDSPTEDGKLKSATMSKENRHYYLDMKENQRGRFLRVRWFVVSCYNTLCCFNRPIYPWTPCIRPGHLRVSLDLTKCLGLLEREFLQDGCPSNAEPTESKNIWRHILQLLP